MHLSSLKFLIHGKRILLVITLITKTLVEEVKPKMMTHGQKEDSKLPQEGIVYGEKLGKITIS
jgi:hypothetical protein